MEELEERRSWCSDCALETRLHVTYLITTRARQYLNTVDWCENCTPVEVDWEGA